MGDFSITRWFVIRAGGIGARPQAFTWSVERIRRVRLRLGGFGGLSSD
jgi:hypothetical protein